MVLSTECSKCKSAMPNLAQALMFGSKMKVTGYLCPECGHWNNLKRRKWFRAQLTKLALDFAEECAYEIPCKQCIHPSCKNFANRRASNANR